MPAKTEAYVILLCREPCLRQLSVKDSVYDTENWMPLIENKALLPWLVRPPSDEEYQRSRKISPQQINRLEDMWKERPAADIKDLEVIQVERAQ